jgi:hypothetical protein
MPRKPAVVSHWHQLYENFSTSSRDFYTAVEEAIKKRDVPDVAFSRVTWKEGGILSAKREYLRVARGRQHWDICAAPYGTGFFFSSRLAVFPSRLAGFVYLVVFLACSYGVLKLLGKPYYEGWRAWSYDAALVVAFFLFAAVPVRLKLVGDEDAMLAMPVVGFLYEKLFNPETYFKEDTDIMFMEAVEAAMHEVVNATTSGKGLRALAPESDSPGGEGWGAEATG